ncbi:MAG: response regulator transcription factor [Ignavibacteriales bacterium]|nr:response regulator transcription factor [Ignavibacteriales bacterium]
MKLFVADDSSAIRERIVRMVSELKNAEVVGEAADGAEALRRIPESKPDLVILDLKMPVASGFEVLPLIKGLASHPLVMVLTNYATSRHREECKKLGADYFFDKSREFEKAIDVIEALAETFSHSRL